jgi:hypothetical protein
VRADEPRQHEHRERQAHQRRRIQEPIHAPKVAAAQPDGAPARRNNRSRDALLAERSGRRRIRNSSWEAAAPAAILSATACRSGHGGQSRRREACAPPVLLRRRPRSGGFGSASPRPPKPLKTEREARPGDARDLRSSRGGSGIHQPGPLKTDGADGLMRRGREVEVSSSSGHPRAFWDLSQLPGRPQHENL